MKIFGILVCVFLLSAICMAEETEYFDWKGSKLYASKNYTDALVYFEKALSQDPATLTPGFIRETPRELLKTSMDLLPPTMQLCR